jgi:hypothetical protein
VRNNQVTQVRGYADQMLRVKDNPTDPSNRRISILVKNDTEAVPDFSAAKVVNGCQPRARQRPAMGSRQSCNCAQRRRIAAGRGKTTAAPAQALTAASPSHYNGSVDNQASGGNPSTNPA